MLGLALTWLAIDPQPLLAEHPRFLFGDSMAMAELNTQDDGEYSPSVTADGLELFYVEAKTNKFRTARRTSTAEAFESPVDLQIRQSSSQGASISPDGLTLYYADGATVFASTRQSREDSFENPVKLIGINTAWVSSPKVSFDGRSLYMRTVTTSPYDSDIYVAQRASTNDPWQPATPLSDLARDDRWEAMPMISRDGLSLFLEYATADGSYLWDNRGDSGRGDIRVAVRSSVNDPWSRPFSLGDTVNSDDYESFPFLADDGSTLYFSRDASDWIDSADLYQTSVLPFVAESLAGSGSNYTQNFDELGTAADQPGSPMPPGWTFTANDVVFNQTTTRGFPVLVQDFVGAYNAGADDASDRALVTDVTTNEAGELDFRARVTDGDLHALRLGFDIEAWQVRRELGANLGEAAFDVVLEAGSEENGFQLVADLGEFTTGKTLARPANGNLVDGNDPAYRHSFDTGPIDVGSIPAGATLRTRWIGTANSRNVVFGLDNVSLRFAAPGDANIDGIFNSTDLIDVLANGEYEDAIAGNSTWSEGDWTGDKEFDSGDLVAALASGGYVEAAVPASVPEPTGATLLLGGLTIALRAWRSKKVKAQTE
jgi:hypothetical protein